MQRAGMFAGGSDGVVAHGVADMPSVQTEDAFDPALAPATPGRLWNACHDSLECRRRLAAGFAHLVDLEVVLDHPQLAECHAKLMIGLVDRRPTLINFCGQAGVANLLDHLPNHKIEICWEDSHRDGAGILA